MIRFSGTLTLQYDTPFSPFSPWEYEKGLDWLVKEGFDGAELCISHYNGVDVEAIGEELTRRGLGCSTISTGQAREKEGISFLHKGDALKKAQQRMKEHIDAAAILNSHVTMGLIRGIGDTGQKEQNLDILAENMVPVIDYAERQGIMILLEAINRYETCLLNNADSVMDFIERRLGNPRCVGVLWDLFHGNIEDSDPEQAIKRMGGKIKHIHLADSNRWFPGYGHIDIAAIVGKLKTAGFDGYLSYECLNLPSKEAVRREAGKYIQFLGGIA